MNTTGNLQLQIQSETVNENISSLGGVLSQNISEIIAPSQAILDQNYDANYLNPDLESLLNSRGFSTLRPEILGLFNFLPPLEGSFSTSESFSYTITSAGELFDYQCQLKQLRYTDVLLFLEQMLGFKTESAEYGLNLLPGSDTLFATISTQESYLENYNTQMRLAKNAIEYLYSVYLAVYNFVTCIELQDSYKVFESEQGMSAFIEMGMRNPTAGAHNSISASVIGKFPQPSLLTPALISKFNFTDMDFSTTWSTGALSSAGAGMSDNWIISSSSTSKFLQLLNFIGAAISGLNPSFGEGFSLDQIETNGLAGINSLTTDKNLWMAEGNGRYLIDNALSYTPISSGGSGVSAAITIGPTTMESFENSYGQTMGWSGSGVTDIIGTSPGTSNTGTSSIVIDTDPRIAQTSYILYLAGLDTIQGYKFLEGGTLAGREVGESTNINEFIKSLYGRDIFSDSSSILDSIPAENDNITKKILIDNEDTTHTDSRSIVESLTSTNSDLASGVASSRSGRSYFCDELTTLEIDEAISRLDTLTTRFSELGEYLKDISYLMGKYDTGGASGSNLIKVNQWGYLGGDGSSEAGIDDSVPVAPSTLMQFILLESQDAMIDFTKNDCGFINRLRCFDITVCAMASENDEILFMLLAYLIAKYEFEYLGGSEEILTGCVEKLRWAVSYHVIVEGIENNAWWFNTYWGNAPLPDGSATADTWSDVIADIEKRDTKVNTDFQFYPSSTVGWGISRSVAPGWSNVGEPEILEFWNEWLTDGVDIAKTSVGRGLFLAESIIVAVRKYCVVVNETSPGVSSGDPSLPEPVDCRGFSHRTRIIAGLSLMVPLWNKFLKAGLMYQYDEFRSSDGETVGQGKGELE